MFNPKFYNRYAIDLLLIPALLLLAFLFISPMKRALLSMKYPYQLDYAEGFLAVEAQQLSSGNTIYPSLKEYPYLVGNYPPVFPLMQLPFFLVFGPSLFWGRLLVFLFALGIGAVMFMLILNRTGSYVLAILGPLLFFNTYAVYEWIGYVRVDIPAIFFSLAGLAVIDLWRNKRWGIPVALALFVLSVNTKQIQIFAPAASCLYLLILDWKRGLKFTALLTGLLLVIFLFLCAVTGGQYFKHTVEYNANVYQWFQVKIWVRHIKLLYPGFMLSIFLLFATVIYRRVKNPGYKNKQNDMLLFEIYAVLGIISFFAIGKVGAASNYLIEMYVALSLFLCVYIGSLKRRQLSFFQPVGFFLVIIAVIFLITLQSLHLVSMRRILFSRPNPGKEALEKGRIMDDILSKFPDPVLCEQPVFLLRENRPVLFQPFIMSQLAKEGKWNQGKFLNDIRKRKFSLIMTGQDMEKNEFLWQYTKEMRNAVKANYRVYLKNKPSLREFMESEYGGISYYLYVPMKVGHKSFDH